MRGHMTEQTRHSAAEEAMNHLDDLVLGEYTYDIELTNITENHALTVRMANQARRVIRIFTRDLDPPIYDQNDFVDACKTLALGGRFASIEILAFESHRIAQRGHRLVNLSRTISSHIQIRRPEKQFENHMETFMTVDETGYIYRKNTERFEGIANFNNPREARELDKLFARMWERSQTDTEIRQLHI